MDENRVYKLSEIIFDLVVHQGHGKKTTIQLFKCLADLQLSPPYSLKRIQRICAYALQHKHERII